MEEMVRRSNYTGAKLLITNLKTDKKNVLSPEGILRTFDVSSKRIDAVKKVYYDTPDFFFRKNGINISTNHYSEKNKDDITVRYDSSVSRIEFLSNLPDTYTKKLNKTDSISKHYNYMATAILELVPKGLTVDAFEVIQTIKPMLIVTKKRERYRVVHNDGLKVVLSFELNTYKSMKTGAKHVMPILDIRMDSPDKFKDAFKEFVKRLNVQETNFIKQKHSDLFIGQEYLEL